MRPLGPMVSWFSTSASTFPLIVPSILASPRTNPGVTFNGAGHIQVARANNQVSPHGPGDQNRTAGNNGVTSYRRGDVDLSSGSGKIILHRSGNVDGAAGGIHVVVHHFVIVDRHQRAGNKLRGFRRPSSEKQA
ncbi:MAG TPA: hypothetical protein VFR55_11480 [Dehalococcoidia bacterium]|nr:hypothetical protein [Dehalococcoidia bacterium]